MEAAFLQVYQEGDTLVSGHCWRGADEFAERLAASYEVPITLHPANWERDGRSAGFKRNGLIAADADLLIACVAQDRTGGTEDTVRKFLAQKLADQLILV